MARNRSSGFIEILFLIAIFWGLTAAGILHVAPQLKSLAFSSIATRVVSPTPTITPDPVRFDHAVGIQIIDGSHVEVQLDGERMDIPLIGLEEAATPSANVHDTLKDITQKVSGKTLYMIYSSTTQQINGVYPRYVFLDDGSSLNSYLIAQGVTQASTETHPYLVDFTLAQEHAKQEKKGIWADKSVISLTPSPTKHSLAFIPSPTPTLIPTRIPTVRPTSSNTIVTHPSPTLIPTINLNPYLSSTSSAVVQKTSLSSDLIFNLINQYRTTKNLKPFEKDTQLCSLAQSRAPELYDEIFVSGNIHSGFYSRNIPYWMTENMASYPTEELIVKWWLTSPIHRAAIESNYTYSCGACSGTSCTQLFTSYVAK